MPIFATRPIYSVEDGGVYISRPGPQHATTPRLERCFLHRCLLLCCRYRRQRLVGATTLFGQIMCFPDLVDGLLGSVRSSIPDRFPP
jgi:hypothetical protein